MQIILGLGLFLQECSRAIEYEEDFASEDEVPSYLSSSALGIKSLEEVVKTVQKVEVKMCSVIKEPCQASATTSGTTEQTVALLPSLISTSLVSAESAVPIASLPADESAAPTFSLPTESFIIHPIPSLHETASSGQNVTQEEVKKRKTSEGSGLESKRVKSNGNDVRRSGRTKISSKRAMGM